MSRNRLGLIAAFVLASLSLAPGRALAGPPSSPVTFTKDVLPIFQDKCQVCHRAGTVAPMSLLTYEDARPWARSIRLKVAAREMPPWMIDRSIGIQEYKNDISLTDAQVATIVAWVDGGALKGDPKDAPAPVTFKDEDQWAIGKPDLIVETPMVTVPAKGADWWPTFNVPTGLTEDRYVKAIETMPDKAGRNVTHHAVTSITQDEDEFIQSALGDKVGAADGRQGARRAAPTGKTTTNFSEFVTGKYGDVFAEGSGRLMKAGSVLNMAMHYHTDGEQVKTVTRVGIIFYPKGYVPKYIARWLTVNPGDMNEVDIPPNEVSRVDGYYRLPKPTRLDAFEPHMHMRGKAQCLEAIFPYTPSDTAAVNARGETKKETIACTDRFDFNWQVAYDFADDAAPLLPAGTILHQISIYDNTANNKRNPDPTKWVGFGQRSVDEMSNTHITAVFLTDEDYARLVAERKAKDAQKAAVTKE
jgi:hypothetical protein